MSNTIRIKRRANGGGPGAPSTLANAELAFNEQTNILYYGTGTGGTGGSATSIIPIAGNGAFVDVTTTQTIAGTKTFSSTITGNISGNAGSVTNGVYTTDTGTVTNTMLANSSLTVGTTNIALGASSTTLAGLSSVTSANFYGAFNGNSSTATALASGRTISITGDLSYTSATFDGTSNVSGTGTLATVNSNVGTFTKVTVNAKGLTTAASQASLSDLSSPTGSFSMNSQLLTNLLDPISSQDAATKNYVDNVAQGLDTKASCLVATTANITLSGTQTVDGIAVVAGDRVLVKNQTAQEENGIYVVSASAWSRSSDADTWAELISAYTFVESGSTQSDTGWVCTINSGGTIGTTPVTWTQFSGAGTYVAGTGLTLTGNSFAITNTTVSAGSYGNTDGSTALVATVNAQGQLTALASYSINVDGGIY